MIVGIMLFVVSTYCRSHPQLNTGS